MRSTLIALSFLATTALAEELPTVTVPPRAPISGRSPVPYVPFELKDAQGRPVPSDATAGGVRAADRVRQLNDTERFLTGLGYTLRRPDEIPPEVYASGIDPAVVTAQKDGVADTHVAFDPSFMHQPPTDAQLTSEGAAEAQRATQPSMEGLARLAAPQESVTEAAAASWNDGCPDVRPGEGCLRRDAPGFDVGKRDLVYLSSHTYMQARGDLGHTNAVAESGLEAGVLNHGFKVLHALARMDGYDKGGDTIHVEATKFGKRVFSFDSAAQQYKDSYPFLEEDKPLFQTVFVIVVVPVTVRVGVRARGEMAWNTPASYTQLGLRIGPNIMAAAYAQAAVGAGIEAGIDGEVTLIEDDLAVAGSVKFRMSPERGPFFQTLVTGENSLTALDGRISLYAKVPCGIDADLWPPSVDVKMCTPRQVLFGWDGITLSRAELFNAKYVWWQGGNGVPGGASSDDTVTAAILKDEQEWAALEKDERQFLAQLSPVLAAWTPDRIRARGVAMQAPVQNGNAQVVALAEALRQDVQ